MKKEEEGGGVSLFLWVRPFSNLDRKKDGAKERGREEKKRRKRRWSWCSEAAEKDSKKGCIHTTSPKTGKKHAHTNKKRKRRQGNKVSSRT